MGTPLRLFLCLFLTGIHISLYSQAEESRPADRVSIKGTYTLKKIFDLIYRQTKQQITYANTLLDDRERVTVDVSGTIDEALTVILAGKAITWVYSEGYVALRKKSAEVRSVSPVIDPPVVTVSGVVTDEEGNPLPGVTIKVKNSRKGTQSNLNGAFVLSGVEQNAILIISSIGFDKEEISIKEKQQVTISLKQSRNTLGEVVVAYGVTTQRSNTGAVTVIKGEQIQTLPNRSFDKSLQGLVPGLQITNGTGQPGGGVSNMVLRGISTAASILGGSTTRNPLFVIDGIPVTQDNFQNTVGTSSTPISNPLAQINPSDIESVSVLRDAAAIALYGSKAGNGVILVTTKRGKPGKTLFTFRSQVDISFLPRRNYHDILSQEEYVNLLYDTYRNTNPTLWTDAAIKNDLLSKFPYYVSGTDTLFYPSPDLRKELFRNAATFSNELSMSGGNEKTNFYFNFEYTKQDGIVNKTGYDRKSLRFNFENKPLNWLTLGTKTFLSYNIQDFTNPTEADISYGVISTLSPLNPIRDQNGDYFLYYPWGGIESNTLNPKAAIDYNFSRNVAYRGISKVYGEVDFMKFFKVSSSVGVDFMLAESTDKYDPRFRKASSNNGSITDMDRRNTSIISTNLLTFRPILKKKHSLDVVLGQEAQIITTKSLGGEVKGDSLTLSIYDQLSSPRYTMTSLVGRNNRQTLLSYFGQLTYGFNKRYFVSASGRRDGSSRFGASELWGNYWSVGGGWVISEETFMSAVNKYVNYLKFRGSLGVSGSSGSLDPSTKYDLLKQGLYAGGTTVMMSMTPGNPEVKWEKTFSWNIGMEARLFQNRLLLNADLYKKKTSDLIYGVALPTTAGYSQVAANIGDMSNRGIELALTANLIRQKDLRLSMNASFSRNRNVLEKSNVPFFSLAVGNLANEEGRNFNSFYLRKWIGVNPSDGKPLWMDSTGKGTSSYNKAIREFVGKPQPDGFGSLAFNIAYKGVELSMQLYYQYGNQILNDKMMYLLNDGVNSFINQSRSALDYWKNPGDNAVNPRRTLSNSDGGRNPSTRYLIDGSYLKLSNVIVAYNFSQSMLERIYIKQLKAFIQGNNLAIWTCLSNQDPDNANLVGAVGNPYPNSQTFSIGLQASF